MIFIAHRGCISGSTPLENHPDQVKEVLKTFNVEIDVWKIDDKWYLGHDEPRYEVDLVFLLQRGLWAHAKNIEALESMAELLNIYGVPAINAFWHETDKVTLTTWNYLWTYPGGQLTKRSVCVLPETGFKDAKQAFPLMAKCHAVCTDFPLLYSGAL